MKEFAPVSLSDATILAAERQRRAVIVTDDLYRYLRTFIVVVGLIVIALGTFRTLVGATNTLGRLTLLKFDSENTLPAWWSTVQLFLAAMLVFLTGIFEPNRRWKLHWFVLGIIFLFLSLDEAAEIHETVFAETLAGYHFTGFLRNTWVIPYAIACVVIGALYLPFVLALPSGIRGGFVLAGTLYISAAMGAESIGSYLAMIHSELPQRLLVIAEEGGEIIAIAIFILALLSLLRFRTIS